MTLPVGNRFQSRLSVPVEGTRPATAWGIAVTPGNNAYGTAVEVVSSADSGWDNGDGYRIEIEITDNNVAAADRAALVTLIWRRPASGVDVTDNELDFSGDHGMDTADGPLRITTTGGAPAGLATGTDYWVIRRSARAIAFATSEANARIGTAIDITTAGTGTHTVNLEKIRHLSAAGAGTYTSPAPGGGHVHAFDLWIPTKTAIDAKATVDNATVGTLRVSLTIHQNPTKPWTLRTGTFVRTIGVANVATSEGIPVTPGTASEGAWTEIGTLADDAHAFELGIVFDGAVLTDNAYEWDYGFGPDSGNVTTIRERVLVLTTASEQILKRRGEAAYKVASGQKLFARGQVGPNASTGNPSALLYALGGRCMQTGQYTVGGSVRVNGVGVGAGKSIDVFAVDADGVAELVGSAPTDSASAYALEVPENVRTHFASYVATGVFARSPNGTPEASQFNIDFLTGSGGSASAPAPVVIEAPFSFDESEARDLIEEGLDNLLQQWKGD